MAKMKDLVMDILEDFENRVPVSVIAANYGMTVEEVEEVLELYSVV